MPTLKTCSGSVPLSKTIFTGILCTTLTKLPVAFSAGKSENTELVSAIIFLKLKVQSYELKVLRKIINAFI